MSGEKRKAENLESDAVSDAEKKKLKQKDATNGENSKHDEDEKPKTKEPSGTLLICGQMNWDCTGRTKLPKSIAETKSLNLWSPHVLTPLAGTRIHKVIAGCASAHSVVIDDLGQVWSWGRNEHGQLGHGDQERRNVPTMIESLQGIRFHDGAAGRNHNLILTDEGEVYSFGSNNMGQCGVGTQSSHVSTPKKINFEGKKVVKLGCGGEFSMLLDEGGSLHSFGCPEYGQLGHNTDGKYMDGARYIFHCELVPVRVSLYVEKTRDGVITPLGDVEITSMACGINHTVAVDKKQRVFSWGFGGYGRLGHDSPKDEYVPRLVKFFDGPSRGADSVYCGSTYSIATMSQGAVYLWGQRGRSGEANMYPKPVQDLHGWNIRAIGCSFSSMVVAAEDTCISWGSSPCYGELGLGEGRKSCSKPMEIRSLDGIFVHDVACGMAHTLIIARDEGAEDRKLLETLPEFDPE